jgi:hypothetical protein
MAASGSSSNRSGGSRGARKRTGPKTTRSASRPRSAGTRANGSTRPGRGSGGLSSLAEQLVNRIIKPLGLVVLSRERIQETLEEAADRGRLTRSDANELGTQLVELGRRQTEDLLADVERLLGRGREQLGGSGGAPGLGEPLERLARGARLARRKVAGSDTFPIVDYDELTAAQVQQRLGSLSTAELRKVGDHERRHANRKSVLAEVEKLLG